ncbi:uncharacterized protein FOMMEDRAFT_156868 [Fomitiporia mediterranea MF3/22]|uniref:uncharacterized protein n=1 Tax=Fomitiporia mediterranea (strain MF3/22) TaxID=694068 RepID=UPI0004408578|nr:uncharacterized protein FOMMEDRAFT_156868 [Fomitiporia mediterranea MF3/22]EJD03456.1 hypothetical protein FOMMEDRAFT_156868 [Fomitiporia mediterranea MF3/22]
MRMNIVHIARGFLNSIYQCCRNASSSRREKQAPEPTGELLSRSLQTEIAISEIDSRWCLYSTCLQEVYIAVPLHRRRSRLSSPLPVSVSSNEELLRSSFSGGVQPVIDARCRIFQKWYAHLCISLNVSFYQQLPSLSSVDSSREEDGQELGILEC